MTEEGRTWEVRKKGELKGVFSSKTKAETLRCSLKGTIRAKDIPTKCRNARSKLLDADGVPDPWMVETMDDLREYEILQKPSYARNLNDPEIWAYLCDYWKFVEYNERGNQPSLSEDAETGALGQFVDDLTKREDSYITEYLDSCQGKRARDLEARRASIQSRFGVQKFVEND